MEDISISRLAAVCPVLAAKVQQMSDQLSQEGILIRVVQGLRTWAEQDALFAQGRTAPGKRVTNVPGGRSWHNFGLAVDCVPSTAGLASPYNPDWNPSHPTWKRMEEVGIGLGLDSGSTWRTFPDMPHFQLTGKFPESAPNEEVQSVYKLSGLKGVWQAADIGYIS